MEIRLDIDKIIKFLSQMKPEEILIAIIKLGNEYKALNEEHMYKSFEEYIISEIINVLHSKRNNRIH
jgi:hypothetical protein